MTSNNTIDVGLRCQCAFMLAICCLLFSSLSAQIVVSYGASPPAKPSMYAWHQDTVSGDLWLWKGQWDRIASHATTISACHRYLMVKSDNGFKIYQKNGVPAFMRPQRYFCGDSVLVVYTSPELNETAAHLYRRPDMAFLDHQGRVLFTFEHPITEIEQVTLQGMAAWCLPAPIETDALDGLMRRQRHFWGIFGENGKWLVEPLYDEEFRFVEGAAEVKLYGKQMLIDEYGKPIR